MTVKVGGGASPRKERPQALNVDIPRSSSKWSVATSTAASSSFECTLDPDSPTSPRTPPSPVPTIFEPLPDTRHELLSIHAAGDLQANYEIGEQLGQGGYGVVQKGTCRATGQAFAVKSVKHDHLESRECYDHELVFAWRVDHPYVVHLCDSFQDDSHLHFVMELCTGGCLNKAILSRRMHGEPRGLPACQVRRFVWEMLSGIGYLHHHRIVHRDCKPENYLLQNSHTDTSLKLIDFGFATRFHHHQPLQDKVGTPDWAAPEIMEGSYNEKCDLWSIGAVCFFCCVGSPPYTGATAVEVLKNIRDNPPEFNPGKWDLVKPQVKRIVQAMLVRDPAERLSANELADANKVYLTKVKIDEAKLASDQYHCCTVS